MPLRVMHLRGARALIAAGVCLLLHCSDAAPGDPRAVDAWNWQLPKGFPAPRVPEDNPMNAAKVSLGRRLFFDTQLSFNQSQSCASCHVPERAFAEDLPVSVGSTGERTPRNAPSLTNVAYAGSLHWANPLLHTLEQQALLPMFNESPVELGWSGKEGELVARLQADAQYPEQFRAAFPEAEEALSLNTLTQALAAFERTLISGNSDYDRFIAGDDGAISGAAKQGLEMFFSEKFECFHCHGGFNFTQSIDHAGNVFDQRTFHNNGLYNLDGQGSYPADNQGLFEFTQESGDRGKFRAPTLRNIEVTGPYMHDGSIATLDGVLDHYAAGGRVTPTGPHAGDGRNNPNKSSFVPGFDLSDDERQALLAFLRSLTDDAFLNNPDLRAP